MKEKIGAKYNINTATALVVGIVIGIGIYFKTSSIITLVQDNVMLGLLVWAFGGLITIVTALCFAEFAGSISESGGDITYLQAAGGDKPAFMLGWGDVIIGAPSLIAVLGWIAALFFTFAIGCDTQTYQLPIALVFIIGLYAINLFSPKAGGKGQVIMTVIKMVPLFAMIVFGLFYSDGNVAIELAKPIHLEQDSNLILVFMSALIPTVFAFNGWTQAATVSCEIENPKKNVPKAIIFGVIFVTVVYILLYLAFANTLPANELAEGVPFGVAQKLFGTYGAKAIMFAIVISALGALNGVILGTIRRPYSLAIKNLIIFPDYFAKINEKYDIPMRSGLLMFALSLIHLSLFYLLGDAGDLSAIGIVINLSFYIIIYVGLIRLRVQNKLSKDGYRTPWFPAIPVAAIILTLILVIGLFFIDASTTRNVIISFFVYGAGFPLYFVAQKQKNKNLDNDLTKKAS